MNVVLTCFLLLLETNKAFKQSALRHRLWPLRSGDTKLYNGGTNIDNLFELSKTITVADNSTATLVNLINFGDLWTLKSGKPEVDLPLQLSSKGFDKVPGCMADVRVKTSLTGEQRVEISGWADSRVAQGMLALLSQGLEGATTSEVLSLSPTEVARQCGLSSLLPIGRLNGLQNMVDLIQRQVQDKLTELATNKAAADYLPSSSSKVEEEEVESSLWSKGHDDEVAVLLSGGVDSSVALKLLQEQGHKVRAFYLKIWLEDEVAHLNQCPWEEDLSYAQSVCEQLQVPLETLSLQKEYWREVVQYTFDEARRGRTPNPDIMCNSRIKFGMFYEYVGKYFSKIATGHYAQVLHGDDGNPSKLLISPDEVKDQTYFLSNLRQDQLAKAIFPIGHLAKPSVRKLADEFNLPTRHRKDSQGICFLGKLKFDEFIAHYLGEKPGPILCYQTGRNLGQHRGLWFHTIGQRKGLGPLLTSVVHEGPWYIAAKDPATNTLYVTNNLEIVEKPRIEFRVEGINWISGEEPRELSSAGKMDLLVKLRHGPTFCKATITKEPVAASSTNSNDSNSDSSISSSSSINSISSGSGSVRVHLEKRDKGIAPGQFTAFYVEGECLGAGVISDTAKDELDIDINSSITSIDDVIIDTDASSEKNSIITNL